MGKRVMLIGMVGIGVVVLWVAEAFAYNTRYTAGRAHTTVTYENYLVQGGLGGTPTTAVAEWATANAWINCINQGENSPSVKVGVQDVVIEGGGGNTGVGLGKGKIAFNFVTNADGVESTDDECDASPACQFLRQFCGNPNSGNTNWVPIDVAPITACSVFTVWECTSVDACPCDPTATAGDPLACADHDTRTPELDPAIVVKQFFQLPNPETFQFGQVRYYDIVAATPENCPSLFP